MSDQTDDTRPLDGVRVVELAQWIAGPAAGGIMADWGADVVKVEPASGDPQRTIFAAVGLDKDIPNPTFAQDNRGKRSVVLDLQSEDGLADLHRLLERADVFLTNLRPGALDRLGLAPDELATRYPTLIVAAQSGYGPVGPLRDVAGYDIGAFVSRSGMARANSPEPQPPLMLRGGIGDHVTGMTTAMALMAKLFEREKTGKGGTVETSLFQAGTYAMSWDIGIHLNFDRIASMRPRDNVPTPLVNSYRTADDHWFYLIGLEANRHFPILCEAIDRPDLMEDERFADAALIAKNRAALIAILDDVFASADLDHWSALFEEHEVWWAPCQTIAEVAADPQAEALGIYVEAPGDDGAVKGVATPARFDGRVMVPRSGAPSVGQHTDEVLSDLDRTWPTINS